MTAARVHHFSAGTLCPHGARLIHGSGGLLATTRLVCHCWLVESDAGLILVDTGLGTRDLADPNRLLGRVFTAVTRPQLDPQNTALAQVRALGFDPADVRHIVPTHLDLDHAGGLPDFPDAIVHVHAAEQRAALHPQTRPERERYRAHQFAHAVRWDLRSDIGERWFGFDGVRAIDGCDDVLLIPLHGHSRGHCGVAVRTSDGWQLHAGDAYFFHGEVLTPPQYSPALSLFQRLVAIDDRLRTRNRDRLRELVATHGGEVRVHSAHCPIEFDRSCA